ncbi:MAG TPA: hypothetical protein VF960_04435, partial [Chloroflexota bacterium]
LTILLSACEPAIPHPTTGWNDCISCHGQNATKPYPKWHAERGLDNGSCVSCHKFASAASSKN